MLPVIGRAAFGSVRVGGSGVSLKLGLEGKIWVALRDYSTSSGWLCSVGCVGAWVCGVWLN